MEYIAHKDGERVQTVKEHLYGTADWQDLLQKSLGILFICYNTILRRRR